MEQQLSFWALPSYSCRICGRVLTDKHSIQRGIGPICLMQQTLKGEEDMEDRDRPYDYVTFEPIEKGIVLRRDENGLIYTNVPHLVNFKGSPDGYEWGYGGSGPNCLAVNILELFLRRMKFEGDKYYGGTPEECFRVTWELRTQFVADFICGVSSQGTVIPYQSVQSWIENHI